MRDKNEICLFSLGGLAAILGGVIDWKLGYLVTNYGCCFFAPAFSTLFSAVAMYYYIKAWALSFHDHCRKRRAAHAAQNVFVLLDKKTAIFNVRLKRELCSEIQNHTSHNIIMIAEK